MLSESDIFNALKRIDSNKEFATITNISKETNENKVIVNAALNILISQKKLCFIKIGNTRVFQKENKVKK